MVVGTAIDGRANNGTTAEDASPAPQRLDPSLNPLLAVVRRFSCKPCGFFDPINGADRDGSFQCSRCLGKASTNENAGSRRCAYTSLIYGMHDNSPLIFGALVLGYSLRASGTSHDLVLLHTEELPEDAKRLLSIFWHLQEVPYIISAQDLHTTPYEKARFKQVFTKLHAFNPDVLPYDRVVFLDSDMLVVRNVDALFEVRPPAALHNWKNRSGSAAAVQPNHGERMDPSSCYINAGTMVIAPSRQLFDMLSADVVLPDPQWHIGSWSPEQAYLARLMAGEWSHISQKYNMEVTLHSGVPLSDTWVNALAEDVAIAHFSGSHKVWDIRPEETASILQNAWVRQTFSRLSARSRNLAAVRCRVLHAEWHRCLALALRQCYSQGVEVHGSSGLGRVLRTGCLETLGAVAHADDGAAPPPTHEASPLVGEEVVFRGPSGATHLGTVLRIMEAEPHPMVSVWYTPTPGQEQSCAGPCGACCTRSVSEVKLFDAQGNSVCQPRERLGLGEKAVLWLGEGHALVTVVATLDEEDASLDYGECLVRFASTHAPRIVSSIDLAALPDTGSQDTWQCVSCLRRCPGTFQADGFWYCRACQADAAG